MKKLTKTSTKYEFIDKCVYFPKNKILAIGDMHLGHEFTLRQPGSNIPATQINETKKDLKKVFKFLKKEKKEVKKVIFLGDIKHFFAYKRAETNLILEILELVGKYVKKEDIILIRGNHEKIAEIADKKLVNYYIDNNLAFIHGDDYFSEISNKKIKTIVMGHLHPAITISDSQKVKSEKYKCFLTGKYRSKEFIILPSFIPSVEGVSVNVYMSDSHCIIPIRNLMNFEVHAIGKKEVLNFGNLKNLIK